MPKGSVLGPLLFPAYFNDIWRNIESNIGLFADDCIIYRRITDSSDIDKLQMGLKGNKNTKHLAYTALVRPILEDGAVCWDPCREGQVST